MNGTKEVDDVLDLMVAAANGRRAEGYSFYLNGDLQQMGRQKRMLQARGFDVQQNNVYPCLKPADKERALRAIWETRTEGWWNYQGDLTSLNICTEAQYRAALGLAR